MTEKSNDPKSFIMSDITKDKSKTSRTANRIFYILCILTGSYFCFTGDGTTGLSMIGIALVFDPFDHEISWGNRPFIQRLLLITHVVVLIAGVSLEVFARMND